MCPEDILFIICIVFILLILYSSLLLFIIRIIFYKKHIQKRENINPFIEKRIKQMEKEWKDNGNKE
jgi:hypothetical protein